MIKSKINWFIYLSSIFLSECFTARCRLDFGFANPLGMAPHPLYLKVTNDTAIPTSLTALVRHFPSGLTQDDQYVERDDANTLLNQTANLADPKSMSDKTSQSG